MEILESLNSNKSMRVFAVIGMIALVCGILVYEMIGSRGVAVTDKAYFSDDDGQSYFVDNVKNIPPFDHNGKQAVRAYVFNCSTGPFVGYLEKYTDGAKAALEQQSSSNANLSVAGIDGGRLVKKPVSPGNWVREDGVEGNMVVRVKCPGGASEHIEAVIP